MLEGAAGGHMLTFRQHKAQTQTGEQQGWGGRKPSPLPASNFTPLLKARLAKNVHCLFWYLKLV